MGIDLELLSLDCSPFYHGYGPSCSDKKLVFAIWKLPVQDLHGYKASFPFYFTEGSGPLLLGNEILSHSNLLCSENLLAIPHGVCNTFRHEIILPTYTAGCDSSLRTHLHIVPASISALGTFFASVRSFRSSLFSVGNENDNSTFNDSKYARMFAVRLHIFTHLTPNDMKKICERAKILTPVLSQALESAFSKCTSCKATGRPVHSRKVSFSRILAEFNDHLQVDFLFVRELGNTLILHMIDRATAFSATALMFSRDMDDVASMIEMKWIDDNGTPRELSGDPEFSNEAIRKLCSDHHIAYQPRPARRHNKLGSVEAVNASIRLFVQRILRVEQHYRKTRNASRSDYEILSRATFFKKYSLWR